MARYFTDEQVRTAIVVLEDEFPGTWERIKQAMQAESNTDETKRLVLENIRAMSRAFGQLPFIRTSNDPERAKADIMADVLNAARLELGLLRRKMN